MAEKSGADILVECLVDLGVEVVFGYPGGAVLPISDALYNHPTIRHVLVRHEQGATHMAEGYARSTAQPAVVLVTSGPGATTAATGTPAQRAGGRSGRQLEAARSTARAA